MKKGKIIIISGPSGSGKTTLYKKLLASKKFKGCLVRSVSTTTRPRRKGEKQGRDYSFVSLKMFLYKKRKGHFLESEQVFENHYGTPNKNVRELLRAKKNVLLCIDVKGAKTVCRKFPKAATIFVRTTSLAVLAARLKGRGSEKKRAVLKRLKTAKEELREEKKYKHTIINDNLRVSYSKLEAIVGSEIGHDSSK